MSCPGDEMSLLNWALTILGGLSVGFVWSLAFLASLPSTDRPNMETHMLVGGRWIRRPPFPPKPQPLPPNLR